jgi:hypothetical protein
MSSGWQVRDLASFNGQRNRNLVWTWTLIRPEIVIPAANPPKCLTNSEMYMTQLKRFSIAGALTIVGLAVIVRPSGGLAPADDPVVGIAAGLPGDARVFVTGSGIVKVIRVNANSVAIATNLAGAKITKGDEVILIAPGPASTVVFFTRQGNVFTVSVSGAHYAVQKLQ